MTPRKWGRGWLQMGAKLSYAGFGPQPPRHFHFSMHSGKMDIVMGDTRIFELGTARGKAESTGAKENCCYWTFNSGKLAAGALAVNDRK